METSDGKPITHLQDADKDPRFVAMTENPFLHGCCSCGLWHRVEYKVVDAEGNELDLPEGAMLALRFSRDEEQTGHFRASEVKRLTELNAKWYKEGNEFKEAWRSNLEELKETQKQLAAMTTERDTYKVWDDNTISRTEKAESELLQVKGERDRYRDGRPSQRKGLLIEACFMKDCPPFIYGVNGHATSGAIEEMEEQLQEDAADVEDGTYLYECYHESAEYGFEGRMEQAAYWQMDQIGYWPLEEDALHPATEAPK